MIREEDSEEDNKDMSDYRKVQTWPLPWGTRPTLLPRCENNEEEVEAEQGGSCPPCEAKEVEVGTGMTLWARP